MLSLSAHTALSNSAADSTQEACQDALSKASQVATGRFRGMDRDDMGDERTASDWADENRLVRVFRARQMI